MPQTLLPSFDPAAESARIAEFLRTHLLTEWRRKGFVVAMSGGVDSSVCAALAATAVGPERVLGLCLPERDSDPASLRLAQEVAARFGIPVIVEDIAPALAALGCYRRRDDAVRRVVPEFGDGWGCKLVLPEAGEGGATLNVSSLVVRSPDGPERRVRLTAAAYREIVAATNFKQRVRKVLEYHHADRLHYAVVGTPNRLEYDQGFFVKGGDGLADVKPIAHLFKSQVYALAHHLGVPASVTDRPPTTDTFSLPQGQDEFYFSVPYAVLDEVLAGHDRGMDPAEVASALGMTSEAVAAVYRDIEQKRSSTRYLHLAARLVATVPGVGDSAPAPLQLAP
jgi:NAD+ synthase